MSSFLATGVGLGALAVGGAVSALFSPKRAMISKLGAFTAYVTIEERHHDELVITDHPVEQGAAISDHAYKKPAEVTITVGWTNSSSAAVTSLKLGNYSSYVYEKLVELQAKRILFAISTGKRKYVNMLIQSIDTTTDARTQNAFVTTMHCREVIIVQTKTTLLQPAENQANPQKTAASSNTGTKQPQATNTSLLYRLAH